MPALRHLALGLALSATLHAADRVTLGSGFEIDCARMEAVSATRTRLYTSGENYLEVDSASIRSVTSVPVPPMSPLDAAPAATIAQPSTSAAAQISLNDLMLGAGAQHNLDAALLASVVRAESGGNAHAVSRTGAQGLMQLMPSTARELGVTDSFAAAQNVGGGSAYLDALLHRYHEDVTLALAAYNAGPAAVDRYHGVPPFRETRAYVARVIREFNRRKLAQWHEQMHEQAQVHALKASR